MSDLVVTVPKNLWAGWIHEGDLPGDEPTGIEWGFFVGHRAAPKIEAGERLYIVSWGMLRGYAPVVQVDYDPNQGCAICRKAGAVAVTTDEEIRGFRGWRKPWWRREDERPFPDWKTAGTPLTEHCGKLLTCLECEHHRFYATLRHPDFTFCSKKIREPQRGLKHRPACEHVSPRVVPEWAAR